jgi:hypothetical protein
MLGAGVIISLDMRTVDVCSLIAREALAAAARPVVGVARSEGKVQIT